MMNFGVIESFGLQEVLDRGSIINAKVFNFTGYSTISVFFLQNLN